VAADLLDLRRRRDREALARILGRRH